MPNLIIIQIVIDMIDYLVTTAIRYNMCVLFGGCVNQG